MSALDAAKAAALAERDRLRDDPSYPPIEYPRDWLVNRIVEAAVAAMLRALPQRLVRPPGDIDPEYQTLEWEEGWEACLDAIARLADNA